MFDAANYYIFIFDTVYSPKPCQRFLKGRFICISQPKPRNSTFISKAVVFYRDNLKSFWNFRNTDTVLNFCYLAIQEVITDQSSAFDLF